MASMIWGTINGNGTVNSGTNFTSTHLERGLYLINFSQAFKTIPAVTVTQNYPGWDKFDDHGGNTRDNAVVVALNQLEVKIKTGDGNGDASDRNFCFVAVGD